MIDSIKRLNFWDGALPDVGYFRKEYIEKISASLGNSLVKVLTGQRRSGKSYLLRMIIKHLLLKEKIESKNILYLNMEMYELSTIDSAVKLMDLIAEYREQLRPKGKVYLFLDEIQEINGWEKVINSLSQDHAAEYEIFLSGSNAHLLSKELASYLTGRYLPIEIFPFSYGEYCDMTGQKRASDSFSVYVQHGGMPETLNLRDDETIRNYLITLRDSILLNDIVLRYRVRDVALLQRLCAFLSDSIGSLFSVNSVVRHLNSSGYKTNVETVANHVKYLCDSYLFHEAPRFDIQGKKVLSGERKYFLNDCSFRYYVTPSFDPGIGKYLENTVYLHLRRKGYLVYTGRNALGKIDMVAEKGNERLYCQVAYLLADESVVEREFRTLSAIEDNYPKFVISMDQISMGNKNGIRHVQAWNYID